MHVSYCDSSLDTKAFTCSNINQMCSKLKMYFKLHFNYFFLQIVLIDVWITILGWPG